MYVYMYVDSIESLMYGGVLPVQVYVVFDFAQLW